MSFITKRDRVLHDYELFDLPSRNEGKLKAFASCTDARAWSHFCSDKTEHLVDVIKRNNETCRPKYVPTDVIVNTLMRSKNKEIARLRRKIAEVEDLLAVYDQLDLNSEQKLEIQNAHAAIKEAQKNVEEMFLDLNTSGYTEGIDSDAFETGKSREDDFNSMHRPKGDETGDSILNEASLFSWPEQCPAKMECKCIQIGESIRCDVETSAEDPRIDELQEVIIQKDARLNALQNIEAVLNNDVCEPYCVYAHIHTALVKIFAVLSRNAKYKKYLDCMMAGRDIRNFDIKGKIVFKMKVLEKFNLALISPCTQDSMSDEKDDCRCATQIVGRMETTTANIALILPESQKMSVDKRSQLVADIMDNAEMREILSKETPETQFTAVQVVDDDHAEDIYSSETFNINFINVKRIKDLQLSYDELMNCYDDLKHEKLALEVQLSQHEELQRELDDLKTDFREHNQLLNEKDYYKKKSQHLNLLEEKCMELSEEASSLEVQLKAESEINVIKTNTIDSLKSANFELEKTLSEASLAFEKEKNALQCKLKEMECKIMCQEQQIKSLSTQIDQLLEQKDSVVESGPLNSDEIDLLNEQIKNLKEVILCKEEEKHNLHDKYQEYIAKLRAEIEAWKNDHSKLASRNEYLELTACDLDKKIQEMTAANQLEKEDAMENLFNIITNKSEKLEELEEALRRKTLENQDLILKLRKVNESFNTHLSSLENEKKEAERFLDLAKQESQELLEKVRTYDDLIQKHEEMSKSYEIKSQEIEVLKQLNTDLLGEKEDLQKELDNYKRFLEGSQCECKLLESKVYRLDDLTNQFQILKANCDKLLEDKTNLEHELSNRVHELDQTRQSIELERKKSGNLVGKLAEYEASQDEAKKIYEAYTKMTHEKQHFHNRSNELDKQLQKATEDLQKKTGEVDGLNRELAKLKDSYDDLLVEKNTLQQDEVSKAEEVKKLRDSLNQKCKENVDLSQQVANLQLNEIRSKNTSLSLEKRLSNELQSIQQEKKHCDEKLKCYEKLQDDYNKLQHAYDGIKIDKNRLQENLQSLKAENEELNNEKEHILRQSEDIENALVQSRSEVLNVQANELANLKEELEKLKKEKKEAFNKYTNLQDKLEESENIIMHQNEAIYAGDRQIKMLKEEIASQNNIIKQLYEELNNVVDLGEQIKENSLQHLNQSLNTIQAHQSKATHNMKLELAKMQKEQKELEGKMSEEKVKSENLYLSRLSQLQQDLENIIKEINQLEIKCIGDSSVTIDFGNIENVLESLERIGNYIDTNNEKLTFLADTLSKVQDSSQILVTKAGEAQRIAEIEQTKINKEKEEAIQEKQNLEQQLLNLKDKLEDQVSEDKKIIKDLEATALNRKIIIKKITDDLNSLKNLYENCVSTMNDLQKSNASLIEEKSQNIAALEAAKQDLQSKSELFHALQTELHSLKNKPTVDCSSQVHREEFQNAIESQTDKQIDVTSIADDRSDLNFVKFNKRMKGKSPKYTANEVQILRADLDSSQDFVNNANKQSEVSETDFGNDSSEISMNQSHENVKDNDRSSTSQAIDFDIERNTKQLALATNMLRTTTNDCDSEKQNNIDQSGIFTIYDKSPTSSREKDSDIIEKNLNKNYLKINNDSSNKHGTFPKIKTADTFTPNILSELEDKKSDLTIYSLPTRNSLSLTNLHSEIKSSISRDAPSVLNVSNTLSDHDFYQDKIVYNVRMEKSPTVSKLKHKKNEPLSHHKLSRVGANDKLISRRSKFNNKPLVESESKALKLKSNLRSYTRNKSNQYEIQDQILPTPKRYLSPTKSQQTEQPSTNEQILDIKDQTSNLSIKILNPNAANTTPNLVLKSNVDRSVMAKIDNDNLEKCVTEIDNLKAALNNMEKDYKNKIEVIKNQYDNHIKSILNEHNQGVKSMQDLHEETLRDIINNHENEVEILRSQSIEAVRKAEKLKKENINLRTKQEALIDNEGSLKDLDLKRKKLKLKLKNPKTLTKTSIEEVIVRPKLHAFGPCTCSLDVNISDTIRNIFEQADVNQRKIDENTYLKYIVNKVVHDSIDALDSQELSFLHLKVCRTWKAKVSKEEIIQKRIDTLENELLTKRKKAQRHIAELDRQVAVERRRLDELREAVCCSVPPATELGLQLHLPTTDKNTSCSCNTNEVNELGERRSLGDLVTKQSTRPKRIRQESNRAVLVKMDREERREKRCCNDEQPVRLGRPTAHPAHPLHLPHPAYLPHPAGRNKK